MKRAGVLDMKARSIRRRRNSLNNGNFSSVPGTVADGVPFPWKKKKDRGTSFVRSIDPDLLTLDEINISAFLNYRVILFEVIKKFRNDGKTVLMVTHDVEENDRGNGQHHDYAGRKIVETCQCDYFAGRREVMMVGRDL